ncbi:MAG: NnrS family protein [Rhodospirillales bacterium]|nr:NnrS family protein [Rhodospirillales bacterium]
MTAIPRYRATAAPALLSAGFRPFFLLSGAWAAVAIPLWLLLLAGRADLPTDLPPMLWHAHEMVFGYAVATVAGFLLTAVPNWTGRMPLQGLPLGVLVLLWLAGRAAMLLPGALPAPAGAALDLAFLTVFLLAIGREIVAGRNWRNLPVLAALSLLLAANLLVHVGAAAGFALAMAGIRLGIATLLALIGLIGGRIIPSFTRNWLARRDPKGALPAPFGTIDRVALGVTVAALALWVALPDARATGALLAGAGVANAVRLARWRGAATLAEPLLAVLHLGYAWIAAGLLLLGAGDFVTALPAAAALHALTVGAIGTMTVSVMARATLGHTGRALTAGPGISAVFALVTLAAVLRVAAGITAARYGLLLALSGAAWSGAFGLFVILFARLLATPRRRAHRTA